jgi:hypothetical protein
MVSAAQTAEGWIASAAASTIACSVDLMSCLRSKSASDLQIEHHTAVLVLEVVAVNHVDLVAEKGV